MAVIKAVSSRASIGRAVKYVTKDEKTEEKLISGKDCNPNTAIEEMKATKAMWGKNEGREYYHFVQSFSAEEQITPSEAHKMAKELAEERFKGHEVVLATHLDKDHIHTHFIVNSVNHEDGKKLHWKKQELQRMKDMSDNLCKQYGKSICEKTNEIGTYSHNKYKALERGMTSDYKSYVFDCYKTVSSVKEQATGRDDFIARMKDQGYETTWSDSKKYITFEDRDGNKVRNSNLEKTFKDSFGKEDLEHGFERNHEKARIIDRAKEQLRNGRVGNDDRGAIKDDSNLEIGDTSTILEKLNSTIRDAKDAVSLDDSQRNDRITQEQSIERERNRGREQKTIERGSKGFDFER